MTRAEGVRDAWLTMSADVSKVAIAIKQSQEALFVLARRYRDLSPEDRAIVDELLAEQVQSEDEHVRFDALALVDEFKIGSAVPALRGLADWLERRGHPGAPYEWAQVNRILGDLAAGAG